MQQVSRVPKGYENLGDRVYELSQLVSDDVRESYHGIERESFPGERLDNLSNKPVELGEETRTNYETMVEMISGYMSEAFYSDEHENETVLVQDVPVILGVINLYSQNSDFISKNDVISFDDFLAGSAMAEGVYNALKSNYGEAEGSPALFSINSFQAEDGEEVEGLEETFLYRPSNENDRITINNQVKCVHDHVSGYCGMEGLKSIVDRIEVNLAEDQRIHDDELSRKEILKAEKALDIELNRSILKYLNDKRPQVGIGQYEHHLDHLRHIDKNPAMKGQIISKMDVRPSEFVNASTTNDLEEMAENLVEFEIEVPEEIENLKIDRSFSKGYSNKAFQLETDIV